jgi:Leucine-rich repeat (LRR) protein
MHTFYSMEDFILFLKAHKPNDFEKGLSLTFRFNIKTEDLETVFNSSISLRITKLNLSHNELKFLPDSIGNLNNLKELYIYNNQLESLPDLIVSLVNLETLNLSDNKLKSLPNSIRNLNNLKGLYIYNNQLESLPDWISSLVNLENLYLDNNNLAELPASILNLINLSTLNISNNKLKLLPDSIGNLVNLEELDISKNQFIFLPHSVGNLVKLKILNLSNNRLASIPVSIENLLNLQKLNLSDNRLKLIPEKIVNSSCLEELELHNNPLFFIPSTLIRKKLIPTILRSDLHTLSKLQIGVVNPKMHTDALEIQQKMPQCFDNWLVFSNVALLKSFLLESRPHETLIKIKFDSAIEVDKLSEIYKLIQSENMSFSMSFYYLNRVENITPACSIQLSKIQEFDSSMKSQATQKNTMDLQNIKEFEVMISPVEPNQMVRDVFYAENSRFLRSLNLSCFRLTELPDGF